MKNFSFIAILLFVLFVLSCSSKKQTAEVRYADYVNPFLGTATLWDSTDLGYVPTRRTWGAEVFPGASLPNAMVQVSPVTMFRSGSGYQYEDTIIYAITHTNKGHWNLCYMPILPFTGTISADDYHSRYDHKSESARPGYYQVYLERYGINVEVTSTLRCAHHKYTFRKGDEKKLMVDLSISNERVRSWTITQSDEYAFAGFQETGEKIYFYAATNFKIDCIDSLKNGSKTISVVNFDNTMELKPLEIKIGFSFVSVKNAKMNLEQEMSDRSFSEIRTEALNTWETLLSKIKVSGGTERQRKLFYSSLYRSFLWPALRSDVNGDFTDIKKQVVNKGFHYYTDPSFWDDYRNKLILLGMLSPEVAVDVINSITDKGLKTGFMPTFFHGDHASVFVTGSYLRGLKGFDVKQAYNLMLKNATVEGRSRPRLNEYMKKGYISEPRIEKPRIETVASAGVTKTLEYAYDDYAVALLAKELKDTKNYDMLMKRSGNYKNMFDASTGLMRGKWEDGRWITPFDPYFPYYEYMYREANAWQSSFFAPHDVQGLIALYKTPEAFETKLDSLFSVPWKGYEAHNLSGFVGQYCHGNQPDHNFPYLYYFIGKQEKSQELLNYCMEHFYGMGKEGLALAGMDDAGEMSSWYVFNAIGLYTFSPANPEYIVSVPIFDKITISSPENGIDFTIAKKKSGKKITDITIGDRAIEGYFISHEDLKKGDTMVIGTE